MPPPQASRPTGTARSAKTEEGRQALTSWSLPRTVVELKELGPEHTESACHIARAHQLKRIFLVPLNWLGAGRCHGPARAFLELGASDRRSDSGQKPSRFVSCSRTYTGTWARATVPGQAVRVAYLTIASAAPVALVGIETEAAKQVQLHNMRMNQGVMEMREHKELKIAANGALALAPGGMHLMLLGLKKPLKAGEQISLTFTFVDETHSEVILTVDEPIRPIVHEKRKQA